LLRPKPSARARPLKSGSRRLQKPPIKDRGKTNPHLLAWFFRSLLGRNGAARILIGAQIALTLVLVAGTGLFVSSLERLRDAPLGFGVNNVVEAQLFPVPDGYKNFTAETYYRDLLLNIEALPGVESASYSNFAPLFSSRYERPIWFTSDVAGAGGTALAYWVSDHFLRTMRIPLLAGRDFGRNDRTREARTAIVSLSLARRLSMTSDVIGRHIRFGTETENQDLEVIGIAADARLTNVRLADPATVYINLWQYSYSAKYGVLAARV
jgi:putative ABC transport system permease protein